MSAQVFDRNVLKRNHINMAAVMCVLGAVGMSANGKSLNAPPGMFKELRDDILSDAVLLNGKQLFVDDYIVESLDGAERVMNHPVKHNKNPLLSIDKPWEGIRFGKPSVLYDESDNIFKMWYMALGPVTQADLTTRNWFYNLCYATSRDGITWDKPIINKKDNNNVIDKIHPEWHAPPGVFKDPHTTDPSRRFKMMYSGDLGPSGPVSSRSTNVAYSPDGIRWISEPSNPVVPFSDSPCYPYWDVNRRRYAAILRYGPPNTRIISRVESPDFVHWSPKVTVIPRNIIDEPLESQLYQMVPMQYEGVYFGLISIYNYETLDKLERGEEWKDRTNVQLTYSRNGVTWRRVGKHGIIPFIHHHHREPENKDFWDHWRDVAKEMVFLPYGEYEKEWDWGQIYPAYSPLVVGDEIWIYYMARAERHYARHHDAIGPNAIGLATLRLDGFMSIDAKDAKEATVTTKLLVFIGDAIEINANATGGSVLVEAVDENGAVIEGFSKDDCAPLETDEIHHVVKWSDSTNCHLLQSRPVRLRFYMKNAKLYSFTPRILHNNYIQSYDQE